MPLWAAGIGAAGSIIGGIFGGNAAEDAADTAAEAQYAAIAEQKRQFEITQEQMAPYQEAGLRGLTSYENMINNQSDYEGLIQSNVQDPFSFTAEDFNKYEDPGYQFRLSEGERALNRGTARQGALGSGSRYRGLMDLGQRMASEEFGAARGRAFQDYTSGVNREQQTYNRSLGTYGRQYIDPMSQYGNMAGIGQSTTTGLAGMRQDMTNQTSQGYAQAGAYQAAGQMGQARAWQQGLAGVGQAIGGIDWGSIGTGAPGTTGGLGSGGWNDPYLSPRKL